MMAKEHLKTIALVEPGPSPISEIEFHQYTMDRALVLTTRIPFHRMTSDGLNDVISRLPFAVESIVGARPGLIVINSFAGSCLKGDEMVNTVQLLTGAPAIVPAAEMARHLTMLGMKKVALVSPFGTEYNLLERIYFNTQGIEISDIVQIPNDVGRLWGEDPYLIRRIAPEGVIARVREQTPQGVDALILDSPTFALGELVGPLEEMVGVPVFSTNQILLYSAFRALNIPTDNLIVSKYLDRTI